MAQYSFPRNTKKTAIAVMRKTIKKQSELKGVRREAMRPGGYNAAATRPHPARLLLIEDHADLAEATAESLSRAGLEVRIAESGEDALQLAITFRPDIILCDMSLPDMSGIEVGRMLRRNPVTRGALIVMHSAMSDTDLSIFEREMKIDEINLFLSKPMTEEKIDRLWIGLETMRRSSH